MATPQENESANSKAHSYIEDILQIISNEISLITQDKSHNHEEVLKAISTLSSHLNLNKNDDIYNLIGNGLNLLKSNVDNFKNEFNTHDLNEWYFLLETEVFEKCRDHTAEPLGSNDEPGFSLNMKDDQPLIQEFFIESQDLLGQIEQSVLTLEVNPTHKETLNQIFRVFHTLKGGAGFLGFQPIKNLAHELESLLDAIRRGDIKVTQSAISLILEGRDALQLFIDQIGKSLTSPQSNGYISAPSNALIAKTQAYILGVEPVPTLANQPITDLSEKKPPTAPQAELTVKKSASIVKLDTKKLDALVELVGELIIAQSMVTQHKHIQALKDLDLANHFQQLSRVTTELQRNALSMRMIPIRSVFQKISRLVRDLSVEQKKKIQRHLEGEETELDRNIVEELVDPLMHMIRNAIDHGIETPEERRKKGKTEEGNIFLSAYYQGHGISIQLRDDGRGLNKQAILEKAKQRNLVSNNFIPNDQNIFDFIFAPGFSTAETITDVSGRGVGMDIVKRRLNTLQGRIEVASTYGSFTQFLIQLPLTLAIIDGIQIAISGQKFILPLLAIRESLRPEEGMVSSIQGYGEVIRIRDELIPLIRLGEQLGLAGATENPCDAIVIIVQLGTQLKAVMVDRLIDKKEIVIKSLGDAFKQQKNISGAAILGDGDVVLILDPDALVNSNARLSNMNTGKTYDSAIA